MNVLVSILVTAALVGLLMRLRLWTEGLAGKASSRDGPPPRCAPSACPRKTAGQADRCTPTSAEGSATATEQRMDPRN